MNFFFFARMASRFVKADGTLIEELKHSSEDKNTKRSTRLSKMFIESIDQLHLFWQLWRHWKGFIARMRFPQKFYPLCDKQVIVSALGQLRINFTSNFKVLQKCWENLNLKIRVKLILKFPRAHAIPYIQNDCGVMRILQCFQHALQWCIFTWKKKMFSKGAFFLCCHLAFSFIAYTVLVHLRILSSNSCIGINKLYLNYLEQQKKKKNQKKSNKHKKTDKIWKMVGNCIYHWLVAYNIMWNVNFD